jgi:hypothetical protein
MSHMYTTERQINGLWWKFIDISEVVLVGCLTDSSTLKMEAVCSSETCGLVTSRTVLQPQIERHVMKIYTCY